MIDKSVTTVNRSNWFAIETALQYRIHGERDWHAGMTVNIGKAALSFQGTGPLTSGAIIDIQYVLPLSLSSERAARVRCQGEVLRVSNGVITARVTHARLTPGRMP